MPHWKPCRYKLPYFKKKQCYLAMSFQQRCKTQQTNLQFSSKVRRNNNTDFYVSFVKTMKMVVRNFGMSFTQSQHQTHKW